MAPFSQQSRKKRSTTLSKISPMLDYTHQLRECKEQNDWSYPYGKAQYRHNR